MFCQLKAWPHWSGQDGLAMRERQHELQAKQVSRERQGTGGAKARKECFPVFGQGHPPKAIGMG